MSHDIVMRSDTVVDDNDGNPAELSSAGEVHWGNR